MNGSCVSSRRLSCAYLAVLWTNLWFLFLRTRLTAVLMVVLELVARVWLSTTCLISPKITLLFLQRMRLPVRARKSLDCLSSPASAPASLAVVAHARSTPLHVAHNSGGTGGLLPVQRSTSSLGNSWSDTVRLQGPTRRKGTKGGVSGPAKDLRPVSEVEAGVNCRPAGGVRG